MKEKIHVIRERETMKVFDSLEKTPEHLKNFKL
jgi:hypothetical protein